MLSSTRKKRALQGAPPSECTSEGEAMRNVTGSSFSSSSDGGGKLINKSREGDIHVPSRTEKDLPLSFFLEKEVKKLVTREEK